MTCDEALELLSAALDGELSPAERNTLDGHLAECEACAALFDELAGQSRLLRDLDCTLPQGLSERILTALPEQAPAKQRKVIRWQRWGTLAACLVLVVWAGFALPGQFGQKDAAAQLATDTISAEEERLLSTAESAAEPSAAMVEQEAYYDAVPAENPVSFSITADQNVADLENAKSMTESLPIYRAQCLRVAWSEELSQPEAELITTPEELSELLTRFPTDTVADAAAAYDRDWFDSAALVAVVLTESSGSVGHDVEGLYLTGESCQVVITRQVPEVGTCDMAGWLILIETDPIPQDELTVVLENN